MGKLFVVACAADGPLNSNGEVLLLALERFISAGAYTGLMDRDIFWGVDEKPFSNFEGLLNEPLPFSSMAMELFWWAGDEDEAAVAEK